MNLKELCLQCKKICKKLGGRRKKERRIKRKNRMKFKDVVPSKLRKNTNTECSPPVLPVSVSVNKQTQTKEDDSVSPDFDWAILWDCETQNSLRRARFFFSLETVLLKGIPVISLPSLSRIQTTRFFFSYCFTSFGTSMNRLDRNSRVSSRLE